MDSNIGTVLLVQVLLIVFNGVFACAEIAVLNVNELRLKQLAENGSKQAGRLQTLTAEPAKFLSTIQIAITLAGFLGSAFAAESFSDGLSRWMMDMGIALSPQTLDTIAVVLITVVLAFFSLVFGELVPKRLALQYSEQLALGISWPVGMVYRLFKPLVWLLSVSTNAVLGLCGIDPNQEDEVSEKDIRMLVDEVSEKGAIDKEEQKFIHNVFEFDDITANEVATHRTDVEILWMGDDDAAWNETICASRHTLFPICEDSPDNVVGILNSKDYFRMAERTREKILQEAVNPAYFVPATVKLDVLLRNMKRRKTYLAVVLDEYGGMEGIVTLTDLLEELVGDLDDGEQNLSEEVAAIEQIDTNTWRIIGNVELEEIEQATGLALVSDEYETFTGLVFDALGVVPKDGMQSLSVSLKGCTVQVEKIFEHQIARAVLKKTEGGN